METAHGAVVPTWRENTRGSFAAAHAAGASFVEFDVQVTRDGVPVLWHDNYAVWGEVGCPTSALVADLTALEFRRLAPIHAAAAAAKAEADLRPSSLLLRGDSDADDEEEEEDDVDDLLLLQGGSPTASSVFSVASFDSGFSRGGGSTSSQQLLRQHRNDMPAAPHEPTLRSWHCKEEDHFPTLAEVGAARRRLLLRWMQGTSDRCAPLAHHTPHRSNCPLATPYSAVGLCRHPRPRAL